MSNAIIRIAEVDLSKAEKIVLDVATRLLFKKDEVCFQLSEVVQTSHVVIINLDGNTGEAVYARLPKDNSQQQIILLSGQQKKDLPNSVLVLTRPLRVQTFKDLLEKLHYKFVQGASTTHPVNQSHNKLLDVLLDIQQHQSVVQVYCASYPSLYINAQYKTVVTSMTEKEVYNMVANASLPVKVVPLALAEYHEVLQNVKNHHILLEKIMWCAGLNGSNGKVIDPDLEHKALRLKAWPNFSRLTFDGEHMRLASLLSKEALSLDDLVRLSDITRNTVVGFCNAVYVMGLLELKDEAKKPSVSTPLPEKLNIIKRIANKLKLSMRFSQVH